MAYTRNILFVMTVLLMLLALGSPIPVAVIGAPGQPFAVGVIVNVTVTGA